MAQGSMDPEALDDIVQRLLEARYEAGYDAQRYKI